MSDTLSAMSTKQYRPSRRSWIKLWVNEWLTGTVRWQLTPQQRSMWADLLALAGNSRYPGIVCAGETNGVLDPFPMDYLCSVSRCSEADTRAAFDLFVAQGRIVINEAGVIQIVNWDKYQSEYQKKRQRRTYKEPRRADGEYVHRKSRKCPPKCPPEEVEVEVDGEVEEEHTPVRVTPLGSPEFKTFFAEYPIQTGRKEALVEWVKQRLDSRSADVMLALEKWKACERWQNPQFIPYAGKWLNDQWKSEPVKGVTKNEQGRQRTKAAIERIREQVESS